MEDSYRKLEMKSEWAIEYDEFEYGEFGNLSIVHKKCEFSVCSPRDYYEKEVRYFECFDCKKKAPPHVILQWKIMTGH